MSWIQKACLLCLIPVLAWASQPVDMLNQTAHRLIHQLNEKRTYWRENPKALHNMVKSVVLPHVDERAMAQQAVGRTHWLQASPQTRTAFEKSFTDMIINTYATAMTSAQHPQVTFHEPRGGVSGTSTRVISVVQSDDHPPVRVIYQLAQSSGQWKITDFNVDGISVVNSYQAQFASTLSEKGLKGLVEVMQARR